jgi:hypothetical protein
MRDDVTEVAPAAFSRRARSYLRWYPAAWRERYGEEFLAQMESELTERPSSPKRSFNIAVHGITTRLSVPYVARRTYYLGASIVLAIIVAIGALTAVRYYAPVQIYNGDGTGFTSIGMPVYPHSVSDLSFPFRSSSKVPIHITSVVVQALAGYPTPKVIGADLEGHFGQSELSDLGGWPPNIPASARSGFDGYQLIPALGRTVTLNHRDTLWVGFRAPTVGRAYVVEGLVLTYVRRGVSHSITLSEGPQPDILCAVPQGGSLSGPWCARQSNLVWAKSRALFPGPPEKSIKSNSKLP